MISAAQRKRKIAASPLFNCPPESLLWAFVLLIKAVVAGTNSALVAPRPLRKDRRRSLLVISGLGVGSDKDGSSLPDSLLLVTLLTILPRWLVSWVGGGAGILIDPINHLLIDEDHECLTLFPVEIDVSPKNQ